MNFFMTFVSKIGVKEKENKRIEKRKIESSPMDRKLEVPNYVILFKMELLFDIVHSFRPCVVKMPSGRNGKMFLGLYVYI